MDEVADVDVLAMSEICRQDARNPLLADRVCRALSVGLLPEGVRRLGLWARQFQIGRLSILFVFQDRHELKRVQKREQFASRLRSLSS